MAGSDFAKKRKRQDSDSEKEHVSLSVSDLRASQLGPVLGMSPTTDEGLSGKSYSLSRAVASFPALQPSNSTPFQCYTRPSHSSTAGASEQEFAAQPIIIAGETDSVEFYSTNEAETVATGCKYLVGVHNKKTNTVTLRPAPMQILARRVKALKGLDAAPVSNLQRLEARNNLGETFGTKRAVKAIRAAERNKVDVSAMQGVTAHLQESIEANTAALPSKDEAKATVDSNRLIPPYNLDVDTVADVYALHDIIPEVEFNAIPISEMMATQTTGELIQRLPYKRSSWVNNHITLLFATPTPNKSVLKILFYISAMLAFRSLSKKLSDKQVLQDHMEPTPAIIVEGLVSRFSETARGSSKSQVTSQTETTLLTHMFALCLRVDDFATDTSVIAADLSMAIAKVNQLFLSLGCKVEVLKMPELIRLGLPNSASNTKRAVLRVPFEFPKSRVKRRN